MENVNFSESELLGLGFEVVPEGEAVYLQFIFNKDDYFNSKYLATEDVDAVRFMLDMGESSVPYNVIDPFNKGQYLTRKQIETYIKNGGY